MNLQTEYQPQTAAETIRLIKEGQDPWIAFGQFLDDWRRAEPARRPQLTGDPPDHVVEEHLRWAALLAAAVEYLCVHDGLPLPAWTNRVEYHLPEPWFLYPGWRLRAWQLMDTPTPFRARNIFGGDRILDRV